MYFQREYGCILLLLTLFATVVISQLSQGCTDARTALLGDQVCLTATNDAESVVTIGADNNETLNNFCSSNCRALNNRLATACANESTDSFDGNTVNLVCTTDSTGSCARFLASQELESITNAFGSSGQCESLTNTQTCSPGCATLFQDFINAGECCAVAVLELGSQATEFGISGDQILSACSINPPQDASCQVLGGGSGGAKELKAYGGFLLFAVIMAAVF